MPQKIAKPELIISTLRAIEVELSKGNKIGCICRKFDLTQQTYYRWRKKYGGLKVEQARRFKELEAENVKLKKLVEDLSLDKEILKEAASKNSKPGKEKTCHNTCITGIFRDRFRTSGMQSIGPTEINAKV